LLVGEVIFHQKTDDSVQFVCNVYNKAGNDYKLMPYKVGPKNFCEFVDTEATVYPGIKKVSDFPETGTCPWPAGTYHINGYKADFSKLPPVLDSGDYMIECKFQTGGKDINGIKAYVSILNKAKMW
jgi:hypothetical protein